MVSGRRWREVKHNNDNSFPSPRWVNERLNTVPARGDSLRQPLGSGEATTWTRREHVAYLCEWNLPGFHDMAIGQENASLRIIDENLVVVDKILTEGFWRFLSLFQG